MFLRLQTTCSNLPLKRRPLIARSETSAGAVVASQPHRMRGATLTIVNINEAQKAPTRSGLLVTFCLSEPRGQCRLKGPPPNYPALAESPAELMIPAIPYFQHRR